MRGKGNIAIEIVPDGNYVNIMVSDTGHGIAKSDFQTIFNPGFTSKKRGWGLGLSLVKTNCGGIPQGENKGALLYQGRHYNANFPKSKPIVMAKEKQEVLKEAELHQQLPRVF